MSMYRLSAHSSVDRTNTAPQSVNALASCGNTPTTFVRRFTSRNTRSSKFVERINRWCELGNERNDNASSNPRSNTATAFGKRER